MKHFCPQACSGCGTARGMTGRPYLLWDWNGTLLDDTQAALDTLNIMLARRGKPPVGMDHYRAHFAFPVRAFYATIGFELEREDWDALAQEYHDTYAAQPSGLARDAIEALTRFRGAIAGQSIISALRQDLLEAETTRLGVRVLMDYAYGTDNLDGGTKFDRARALMAKLREAGHADFVMIGDSLHDAEVAADLGIRCVLYGGGSHAPERLAAVAPTGRTLVACVRLARGGVEMVK